MEIPGFTPSRRVETVEDGFMVFVKPPAFLDFPEVSVFLTTEQYTRYLLWQQQGIPIQTVLPELSSSDREKLMSGLDDDNWNRMTRDY